MQGKFLNKFHRITSTGAYLPEIDGIRFIAISMVVLFHLQAYYIKKSGTIALKAIPGQSSIYHLLSNGNRGVVLFFTLSGFILSIPFANQYLRNGKKVSLRHYYLRRLTRLEPPYIIAITGIAVLEVIAHTYPAGIILPHWLASLAYAQGLIYHRNSLISIVLWSLEIELQFYLIAPLLFKVFLLPELPRRILLAGAIAGIIMIQAYYLTPLLRHTIYHYAQFFLAGILLADLYINNVAEWLVQKKWIPILAAILFFTIFLAPVKYARYTWLLLPYLIALLFYLFLKNEAIKKMLSYKFIPAAGGMCYSIYLLHYTIIAVFGRYTTGVVIGNYYLPNLLLQIILMGIPILIISSVFYLYVERPFMDNRWTAMLTKKDKA